MREEPQVLCTISW